MKNVSISFIIWLGIAVITLVYMTIYLITGATIKVSTEFWVSVYGLLIGTLILVTHFEETKRQ